MWTILLFSCVTALDCTVSFPPPYDYYRGFNKIIDLAPSIPYADQCQTTYPISLENAPDFITIDST